MQTCKHANMQISAETPLNNAEVRVWQPMDQREPREDLIHDSGIRFQVHNMRGETQAEGCRRDLRHHRCIVTRDRFLSQAVMTKLLSRFATLVLTTKQ